MEFVEIINGSALYRYNDGTAVAIGVLDGNVDFFDCYLSAYAWSLPF